MNMTLHLRINGMDCADCAAALEKGVGNLNGVQACAAIFFVAHENRVRRRRFVVGCGHACGDDYRRDKLDKKD